MTTTATDISIVLSGGSVNINPNNSLGGNPSATPVTSGVLNNLFDDVSPEETTDGLEDYRCIYLFNDGNTTIWDVRLWVAEDFTGGSTVELGVESKDESQRITLSGGTITGGSLDLSYRDVQFTTTFDPDLGVWASELQDTLDNLTYPSTELVFRNVTVTAQTGESGIVIFDITFEEKDGKRSHELFEEVNNNLTPGTINVAITKSLEGAPINTVAPEIAIDTTPPGGVSFVTTTELLPIILPKLEPDDGFPLWVRRVTLPGADAQEADGFRLRFKAQSLEPDS